MVLYGDIVVNFVTILSTKSFGFVFLDQKPNVATLEEEESGGGRRRGGQVVGGEQGG